MNEINQKSVLIVDRTPVIALVGNPNVGKSTLFNACTGMNQHTGNWPGKTVEVAEGDYYYKGAEYHLIDLPGTYSLCSNSEEERVTAEFLQKNKMDAAVVVIDPVCLERSLYLLFQVLGLTKDVILCINLLDDAKKRGVELDLSKLQRLLGIPVVGTSAVRSEGLSVLKEKIRNLISGFQVSDPILLPSSQSKPSDHRKLARNITAQVLTQPPSQLQGFWERVCVGPVSGRVVMLLLLFSVFLLTIKGANVPSSLFETFFSWFGNILRHWLTFLPKSVSSALVDGIYQTVTSVIAVMLPPIMIFFPLFTLLEEIGYLPRAAFMMDHPFEKCGSCGKQVLTMTMGLGCNAAGVMGCRIISSPRERLIAILTNALVPCNGRFPAMITLIYLFFSHNSIVSAGILTGFVFLSFLITMFATKLLSIHLRENEHTFYSLEIPAFRRPNWKKIVIRSFFDRIIFVIGRAAAVAAPAGLLIWLLQQLQINGMPALSAIAQRLDPVAGLLGLHGSILLAFLLSFPANELLLPMYLMILQAGEIQASAGISALVSSGIWTWETALCTIVFLLFHWPCSTTCMTIRKETTSVKWMLAAILLPTCIGTALCMLIHLSVMLFL